MPDPKRKPEEKREPCEGRISEMVITSSEIKAHKQIRFERGISKVKEKPEQGKTDRIQTGEADETNHKTA